MNIKFIILPFHCSYNLYSFIPSFALLFDYKQGSSSSEFLSKWLYIGFLQHREKFCKFTC